MKTIFIALFQAVEVKNILRTGVVRELLQKEDIRVVLFMKNQVRIEHYQKEFNDPRMVYAAADCQEGNLLDSFFARLKFTLHRTDTTILRRRLFFEHKKNYISYWLTSFLNRCFARPIFRRLARFLDYRLINTSFYSFHFDSYKPELIFLPHLFDETEIHFLREAKKRKIKTIGFINSWDKLTARCMLRLLPDKLVVFNDIVKQEAILYDEIRSKDIFVSGIPQYDSYFSTSGILTREDFFRKIGIDPQKKLIVFIPAGLSCSDSDWAALDLIYRLQTEGKFAKDAAFFIRFPPNDFLEEREIGKRNLYLKYDHPGVRFASKRGGDWDMTFADLAHLKNTLYHMSLMISYGASSASIDAAIFDKPIIHLNFEVLENALPFRSPPKFYEMEHSKKAFSGGGIRAVQNPEKLVLWVNKYLEDPTLDHAGRKKLAEEQCKFLDGKSAKRIADFMLDQINS